MNNSKYPKGSEWRKWDLHIHTPASFHWNGQKFNGDPCSPQNADLVDEMIHALNSAEPEVFAIMDYWTFDGWFALKRRLAQPGAPKLLKKVFPGIELRLMAPMAGRLNVVSTLKTPSVISCPAPVAWCAFCHPNKPCGRQIPRTCKVCVLTQAWPMGARSPCSTTR